MALERWSPDQEAINLIKTKNEAEKRQINDLAQEIRTKRIFNPVDALDVKNVPNKAREVVRNLSGVEKVEDLYNITQDRNKTETQKNLAKENIDKLGKAVFLVMNYGGRQDLANRVLAGSQSVEEVLPEPFKGLGDAVVNQLIKSQEVRGALEEVDLVRSRVNFSDSREVRDFVEEIDDVKSRMIRIKVESQYNQEVVMAKNYLLALKNKYDTAVVSPTPTAPANTEVVDAINRVVNKLPEQETAADKENESIRQMYDFYFSTLLHEDTKSDDPFSNLAPDWMKNDPDKALIVKEIQLANACFNKKKLGGALADALFDVRGEATFGASNEMMQRLYEKVPGVRESMEDMMQDFFKAGVDSNGQFILQLKETNEKTAKNKFLDVRKIQLDMRDSMAGPGKMFDSGNIEKDQMEAIRAISIAWNILYIGNTFEDADTGKWLRGEVVAAQAWNIMHPAQKAYDKFIKSPGSEGTEETFGGQKGQFLVKQIELSKRNRESRELINKYKEGKFHPFPERLFTSYVINNRVNTVSGHNKNGDPVYEEMSMAEALLKGKEINFVSKGSSDDSWGGYYDFASTARTLYDITTGKTPLVLEVNDGKASKEMVDWANALADARNKISRNNLVSPHVNNPEFLLWSIVGSVKGGVYMESPHLVMMTPKVFSQAQYDELNSLFGIRQLVSNRKEKEWVMKALNCDSPGAVNRRQRITGRGSLFSLIGF